MSTTGTVNIIEVGFTARPTGMIRTSECNCRSVALSQIIDSQKQTQWQCLDAHALRRSWHTKPYAVGI
jgi:hypothetical protein